jgi:hypothetical protein
MERTVISSSKIQEGFTSIAQLANDNSVKTDLVIALLYDRNTPVIEATENGFPENEFVHFMQQKHGAGDTGADKRFFIRNHSHFFWKRVSEKVGRNVCGYNFEPNSFAGEYVDGEPPLIDCDRIGVLDRDLPKIEKALEAWNKQHRQFETPSQNLQFATEEPADGAKKITKLFNDHVTRKKTYTEKQVIQILRDNDVLPPSPGRRNRQTLQADKNAVIRCAKAHKK